MRRYQWPIAYQVFSAWFLHGSFMADLRDAFVTGTGVFLPGEPIPNDRIEEFIGRVGGRKSSVGEKALRWNGIETRHYALNTVGQAEHTNASMSASAVLAALDDAGLGREALQHLATATTQGDYLEQRRNGAPR
jgi:3-oxoacyl-[acyl-carrier-protein] synthase III